MKALNLADHTPIVRIPCLAHVIQLSLKDLLAMMKLDPKNDVPSRQWSAEQDSSLRHLQKRGIVYTLAKAYLVFYFKIVYLLTKVVRSVV